MARPTALCLVLCLHPTGCDEERATEPAEQATNSTHALPERSETSDPRVEAVEAVDAVEAVALCPEEMVWVRGDYCPRVEQRCLAHHPEYLARRGDPTVSERCLRYEAPTRCQGERQPLSYCMDRFEYPNRVGQLPRVLTSWLEARTLCEAEGKRLCEEDEFNFACEGPDMLPYATGTERDASACNIDRPYRQPNHGRRMKTYDRCLGDPWCKEEMARLDQRLPIGERMTCISWAGVVDLNGNVNEWVVRPGQRAPHRSGLKGGWWGPVRNRCRPTVGFHKEGDYGYEAGFRCCRDVAEAGARTAP